MASIIKKKSKYSTYYVVAESARVDGKPRIVKQWYLGTIEKIIAQWAPPTENDTESYISNVERWSGVPKNKVLTAFSGADFMLIVTAMSFVENGQNADISAVQAGFNLQTKIKIQ